MRRKPLVIGTDLGLAAVIVLVSVLAWTGTLAVPVLYLVALVAGCLVSVFVLAYIAYLPSSWTPIGVVYAAFGVGGAVAATTLGRTVARLGYGRLLLAGYVAGALAIAGIPFVSGSALVQTVLYALHGWLRRHRAEHRNDDAAPGSHAHFSAGPKCTWSGGAACRAIASWYGDTGTSRNRPT